MSGNGESFLPPLLANGAGTVRPQKFTFVDNPRQAKKAPRQSGGAATATAKMRQPPRSKTQSGTVPTQVSRAREKIAAAERDGRLLSQVEVDGQLSEHDLSRGVMSAIERGLIPQGVDMSAVVGGNAPGLAPLAVSTAPLHKHVDQFRRAEVLTTDVGLDHVLNVKLDLEAVNAPEVPEVKPAPAPPPKPRQADAEAEAVPKGREDARTYAELLDLYSLHEFIIRRGAALRNTPEFTSFKRSFVQQWGSIEDVIKHLEALLTEFGVPLAYIDGKRVAKLASIDLGIPSREDLLCCIANRQDVEPHLLSQAQVFKQGTRGHDVAAAKIQSVVRMRLQRKRYTHLRLATLAAMLIQRQWGTHRAHIKTRKTLQVQRDALIAKWRQTMLQFAADWHRISNSRRVIVHIPSLSVALFQAQTTPFFKQMQRAQVSRLCDLADEHVEIVMLSPLPIEDEALKYYHTLLQAAGVRAPESRLVVLVPDVGDRLPPHTSLTKSILCSSRLMRTLASVIRGKTAYMVPGMVGPDEQLLAARLNIPILGPEPRVAVALGTKSGAKSIFESADAVTPVGAHNIRNVNDLYRVLSRLVAEYPEYPRWLIKLDAEYWSRGHAFLDVRKLPSVEEAHRNPEDIELEDPDAVASSVLSELQEGGAKRIKILNTHVYADWAAFSHAIEVMGCCVEAIPSDIVASVSANLLIEPDGTARLQSVQQQIITPQYTCAGVLHPQTAVPFEAVRDASMSIAGAAFRKKVAGYVSIDFVVFRKPESQALRMWAVDLDLYLTNNALCHTVAMLVTGANYDFESGQCVVRTRTQGQPVEATRPLNYAYSGVLHHDYISALRHRAFFSMCAQRRLTLDNESRTGVIFHLLDVLRCNCVGFVCVGASTHHSAALLLEAIEFLHQQLTAADAKTNEATCNVAEMLKAARNISQRAAVERRRQGASGRR